jgi:hypothetical protein
VLQATEKFWPAVILAGGEVVQVAVGGVTTGLTVTDTTVEFPDPAEFETCTTYFTVVALVMGLPLASLVGAVSETGLLVGLKVELSTVSAAP